MMWGKNSICCALLGCLALRLSAQEAFDTLALQAWRQTHAYGTKLAPGPIGDPSSTGSAYWEMGAYVLLVMGLLGGFWYLWRRLGGPRRAAWQASRPESIPAPLPWSQEAIGAALRHALQAADQREIIRWQYAAALGQLRDRGLIHWEKGKTNHAYLLDIEQTTHYPLLVDLAQIFEQVIYGQISAPEKWATWQLAWQAWEKGGPQDA